MSNGIAPPIAHDQNVTKKILTYVVPASQCNLSCSYCFIKGRHESNQVLSTENYLEVFNSLNDIDFVAIQGYEPLLPESWETTQSIINATSEKNIPLSIVTNGYFLADHIQELKGKVAEIYVSLDGTKNYHNKLRGHEKAYDKAIEGIQSAISHDIKVCVASVLHPKKTHFFQDLPEELNRIGISHWVINPMVNNSAKSFGRLISSQYLHTGLLELQERAQLFGIDMIVDDEFHQIEDIQSDIKIRRISNPNRAIRVSPNGRISKGSQINEASEHSYLWNPNSTSAAVMLNQVFA